MDKSKQAVHVFNKYANEYQNKFMDVSLYQDSLNVFCNTLSRKDANILELACGPGNISKYILDYCPSIHLLGTDLSENMITLAKKNNPGGTFKTMDCRAISNIKTAYD